MSRIARGSDGIEARELGTGRIGQAATVLGGARDAAGDERMAEGRGRPGPRGARPALDGRVPGHRPRRVVQGRPVRGLHRGAAAHVTWKRSLAGFGFAWVSGAVASAAMGAPLQNMGLMAGVGGAVALLALFADGDARGWQ